MSAIDPRMARRRRMVAEHGARRRLRAMIVAVLLLAIAGLGWWASRSELLDIDTITVGGTDKVDVAGALRTAGINEGMPLVSAVRAASTAEEVLEEDPWVRSATVSVLFPGRIEVDIVERVAVAAVGSPDGGWALVADDLTVLAAPAEPPPGVGAIGDPSIAAAGVAFLAVMGDRGPGTALSVRDGDVWVEWGDVQARLGRPSDMEAKAAAFLAMLEEDIPAGWAINLIAPSRPALFQLQP